MNNNFVSTSTDPSGQHRAPVDIWPDLPYRHRDLRHDLPFGCRAWRHEGKDYQNRPHWQRRARPCVFVGWSLDTPSYLLYDIDGHHLFEGTYVTFDETNFPLMDLLLAGETHTADKQIDVDGWRVSANTSIQEADDFTLAHWCADSYSCVGFRRQDGKGSIATSWRLLLHMDRVDGRNVAHGSSR